jgi:hypothetical protein
MKPLLKLTRQVVTSTPLPFRTFAYLRDAVQAACVEAGVPYDAVVVSRALIAVLVKIEKAPR